MYPLLGCVVRSAYFGFYPIVEVSTLGVHAQGIVLGTASVNKFLHITVQVQNASFQFIVTL